MDLLKLCITLVEFNNEHLTGLKSLFRSYIVTQKKYENKFVMLWEDWRTDCD